MCCTLDSAELTRTLVYAGEAYHPQNPEQYIHVLGYQNQAVNKSRSPNAMILPVPTWVKMGPENFLDTSHCPDLLKDMSSTITRTFDGVRMLSDEDGLDRSIQVFRSGSYTVALADSMAHILDAIQALPQDRRPAPNPAIFEAYARLYPDWKLAICAWDGWLEAEPLMLWYEPLNPGSLFLPALDAHDGQAPQLQDEVQRDHMLMVGSTVHPIGLEIQYTTQPGPLEGFLSRHVYGQGKSRAYLNGDYRVDVGKLRTGWIQEWPPTRESRQADYNRIWSATFDRSVPGLPVLSAQPLPRSAGA